MSKKKSCRKCGVKKDIGFFSVKSSNKDGFNNMCKQCFSKYTKGIARKNSNRAEINIPKHKVCGKCNKRKRHSQFSKNRCKKDGLCGYCKECDIKKAAVLRTNNRNRKPEEIIVPEHKICPWCETKKYSNDFTKNKSRKDGLNPYCRACTKDFMVVVNNRRREIKISLNERFTAHDVFIVKQACHNLCICCGSYDDLSVDHFRSLSKLNPLEIGNAIILCRSCNSRKHDKNPEEFFNQETFNEALVAIAVSDILKNGVG